MAIVYAYMGIRSAVLLVAAAASCSIPDEVGIGANTSQYDYFASATGDPEQWPFTNDTGNSVGVNVWASWRLKPQDTKVYIPRPEWIGEMRDIQTGSTHVTVKDAKKESTVNNIADGAGKIADKVRGDAGLQMLTLAGLACLGFFLWLKYRHLPKSTSTN